MKKTITATLLGGAIIGSLLGAGTANASMLADEEGRTVCSSLDTRHSLYTSEYVDASDKAQYSPQASLNFAIEWMQTFGDVSSGPARAAVAESINRFCPQHVGLLSLN